MKSRTLRRRRRKSWHTQNHDDLPKQIGKVLYLQESLQEVVGWCCFFDCSRHKPQHRPSKARYQRHTDERREARRITVEALANPDHGDATPDA